jgi:hypothetical protein
MVNRIDDRSLLGLKNYDTLRVLRDNTYSSSYWTK